MCHSSHHLNLCCFGNQFGRWANSAQRVTWISNRLCATSRFRSEVTTFKPDKVVSFQSFTVSKASMGSVNSKGGPVLRQKRFGNRRMNSSERIGGAVHFACRPDLSGWWGTEDGIPMDGKVEFVCLFLAISGGWTSVGTSTPCNFWIIVTWTLERDPEIWSLVYCFNELISGVVTPWLSSAGCGLCAVQYRFPRSQLPKNSTLIGHLQSCNIQICICNRQLAIVSSKI